MKRISLFFRFFFICSMVLHLNVFAKNSDNFVNSKIYGVTIDDSWYDNIKLSSIIKAIKDMPVKPTVRIVMSKDTHPLRYLDMFKKIHEVAYIMATPVDSYEMKYYKTVQSYKKRFIDSYEILSSYVEIWEIANEINGEGWLGDDIDLIVNKMKSAYDYIHGKGALTALTPYYASLKNQKMQMNKWLKKYVPKNMKENLDYVLISYYEDDNDGFLPNWSNVFAQLQNIFPNSKLGIGECGNTALNADYKSKTKMVKYYYNMPKFTKNFVGGYFWWNFVQDCIPHENNLVYKEICHSMLKSK